MEIFFQRSAGNQLAVSYAEEARERCAESLIRHTSSCGGMLLDVPTLTDKGVFRPFGSAVGCSAHQPSLNRSPHEPRGRAKNLVREHWCDAAVGVQWLVDVGVMWYGVRSIEGKKPMADRRL